MNSSMGAGNDRKTIPAGRGIQQRLQEVETDRPGGWFIEIGLEPADGRAGPGADQAVDGPRVVAEVAQVALHQFHQEVGQGGRDPALRPFRPLDTGRQPKRLGDIGVGEHEVLFGITGFPAVFRGSFRAGGRKGRRGWALRDRDWRRGDGLRG